MLYLVKHYCQCQCRKPSWTVHIRSAPLLWRYESLVIWKCCQKARQTSPERQETKKSPIFHEKFYQKISKNKVLRNSLSIALIFIWALKEHSYCSLFLLSIYRYVKWATMAHSVCKIVPCQVSWLPVPVVRLCFEEKFERFFDIITV